MLIRQQLSPEQLAGALYGASGIPENWISRVAWGEQNQGNGHRLGWEGNAG
jgi:hypothetical protein